MYAMTLLRFFIFILSLVFLIFIFNNATRSQSDTIAFSQSVQQMFQGFVIKF